MQRISALAQLMVQAQAAVDEAELELRRRKEALRLLAEEDLPNLMRELELTEIKLLDGSRVAVVDEVACFVSEERRAAAHAWLEEHGFGGLIKRELRVSFGRGEADLARDAAARVAVELGRSVELKDAVHPGTLKSFIKEQLALGAITDDMRTMFGVHQFALAKLTAARRARGVG
jgi:hypothetical protein